MKYVNANAILPNMLIEELQKYVQAGLSISQLKTNSINLGVYCLSIYAIRKIIYQN